MIKLYNDDCMNILPTIEDNSIDLIITSPPYNLGHTHNESTDLDVIYNSYSDDLTQKEYEKWQINCLNELHRILKPSGLLYYNHKERFKNGYYFNPLNLIQKSNFKPLQTIIWHRDGAVNFNIGRFVNCYETINVAYKSEKYMKINKNSEKYLDVWKILSSKKKHMIASFPLELPLRIIRSYNDYPNLTVMDCFMGEGTTAIASQIENRDFIGIEIDKKTFDYAYNRTRTYQTKLI